MPIPRWVGRVNRRLTNPLLRPLAAQLPHFAVMIHRGRTSGRLYRTPVNVFPWEDGFFVALTYGGRSDWVRNVLATGQGALLHRGTVIELVAPKLAEPPGPAIPMPVRATLRALRVHEFLWLQRRPDGRRSL